MKRECRQCKRTKEIDEFAKADKTHYRHLCKQCYYESKKSRRDDIKNWFIEYKKQQTCTDCGNQDFRVLEFHHLKDKDFNLGDKSGKGYSIVRLQEELDKCIPLCANCHRIRHYNENVV